MYRISLIVLQCIVLYCIVLCGIVLYSIVWCCIVLCCVVLVLCCVVLYCTLLYCIVLYLCYCIVLYYILLYDWYTEVYNNPNRRVQISFVIVHFETQLNQFFKWAVVFMKDGSNKLYCIEVLESKTEKCFQIFSYFTISTSMFSQSW